MLTADDMELIARRHPAAEDAALGESAAPRSTLILDTDLLSTVDFGCHYCGFRSDWLSREARAQLGSVCLLCRPDLPWVADGVRDRPGVVREMPVEFLVVLSEFGVKAEGVTGLGEWRSAAARAALQRHATAAE